MQSRHKGFTLIELIVVIAIIGILAAIMFILLGDARSKGADANVESNFTNARAQIEVYYHLNNQSYVGVCEATQSDTPQGAADFVAAADRENGSGAVTCADSEHAWAIEAERVSDESAYLCVDSMGTAAIYEGSTINAGSNDFVCGI